MLGCRNPSDILTKHVASTLLEQHLLTVGAEFRGGRADSAPTLDEIYPYDESAASKVVRFNPVVTMRMIPAVGRGWPTKSLKMKLWWPNLMSENGTAEAQSEKGDVEASSSVRQVTTKASELRDAVAGGDRLGVSRSPEIVLMFRDLLCYSLTIRLRANVVSQT